MRRMKQISVGEFEEKRAGLIKLHQDNQGKRGYGFDATARKIGALLGFTEEAGRYETFGWKRLICFECPIDKPWVRQSTVTLYSSPSGLCTAALHIIAGADADVRTDEEPHGFRECRVLLPNHGFCSQNYAADVFRVQVWPSPWHALSDLCLEAGKWLGDELAFYGGVIQGKQTYKYLSPESATKIKNNMLVLYNWIYMKSGAEDGQKPLFDLSAEELDRLIREEQAGGKLDVPEIAGLCAAGSEIVSVSSGIVPDENVIDAELRTQGEQARLAGEDVMPTMDSIDQDGKVSSVRDKRDSFYANLAVMREELKGIKKDALAPFKEAIEEKNSKIELLEAVATFYDVQSAIEEARLKSMKEDPIFCVCAFTTIGTKGVGVKVGTKQDITDFIFEGGEKLLETIAEFKHGRDLSGVEDTSVVKGDDQS